jgi:two-component sensor histidine kinase
VVAVIDDGVGLSPNREARDGSIGLQLVRDLAAQLHGEVTVTNCGGASFALVFDEDAREP